MFCVFGITCFHSEIFTGGESMLVVYIYFFFLFIYFFLSCIFRHVHFGSIRADHQDSWLGLLVNRTHE